MDPAPPASPTADITDFRDADSQASQPELTETHVEEGNIMPIVNDESHLLGSGKRTVKQRVRLFVLGSKRRTWISIAAVVLLVAVAYLAIHFTLLVSKPNLIIMISDGWGPAGQTLARAAKGKLRSLYLDDLLVGTSHTDSSDSWVTDSAAGATAYSCGKKSYNGAVSVDPVTKKALGTLLEAAIEKGMATGMAVTSRITHATPAAFSSHAQHRDQEEFIAMQQSTKGVDVLFGGGLEFFYPVGTGGGRRQDGRNLLAEMKANGTITATTRAEYDSINTTPCIALLADSHMDYDIDRTTQPSLRDMTLKALNLLDKKAGGNGFILLVEGSRIDMAAHQNDPSTMMRDALMYDNTADAILTWIADHGGPQQNLLMSVSDHETGGLTLGRQANYSQPSPYHWNPEFLWRANQSCSWMAQKINDGADIATTLRVFGGVVDVQPEEIAAIDAVRSPHSKETTYAVSAVLSDRAEVGWTTHGHTGVDVNRYAFGYNAELLRGGAANDYIGRQLASIFNLDLDSVSAKLTGVPTSPSSIIDKISEEHWW